MKSDTKTSLILPLLNLSVLVDNLKSGILVLKSWIKNINNSELLQDKQCILSKNPLLKKKMIFFKKILTALIIMELLSGRA